MTEPTETRRCKTCRQVKPLDRFYFTGKGRLYRRWDCVECVKTYVQGLDERSKRLIRAHCRVSAPPALDLVKKIEGASGRRIYALTHYYRLRHEAIRRYGGYKCACCGETEPAFLTLDHMDNGGAQHRRRLKQMKRSLFVWLRDNGYPPGFRVLCINCNQGRHRNGGVCPHEQARDSRRKDQ